MSQVDDIIREMQSRLASSSVSYSSDSAANDIYEGFVFALVVDTAAALGARVHYEDVHGHRTNDLVFRTSPGRLYSTINPYTHAVVAFDGTPELEVHLGVYVQGNSRVLHECDVLVLDRSEAQESRQFGVIPRSRYCLLALECKYYCSNLQLGQARGFVGLNVDLGSNKALFVTNVTSTSVVRYLDHRKTNWEHHVLPGNPQVEHLCSEIRKAFRSHVSQFNPSLSM